MDAVKGIYENGVIKLLKPYPLRKRVEVVVVFPKMIEEAPKKKISLDDFSFKRSREALKDYKGNLSDAVIEERRSYL